MSEHSSPKRRFQSDPDRIRAHLAVVEQPFVATTLDVALQQLIHEYGDQPLHEAGRHYDRLQGAKDFVRTWLSLADPTPTAPDRKIGARLHPDPQPKPPKSWVQPLRNEPTNPSTA